MFFTFANLSRMGALLAINLLFLMVWGFTGLSKLIQGMPSWFDSKFGQTILDAFPGLVVSFWLLAAAETLAFLMGAIALLRGEFLGRCRPTWLTLMLVWSLFVFVGLGFGQWLTSDFNGTFQLFTYFAGGLLALHFVKLDMTPRGPLVVER